MAEQKSITQNYATPYKFTGKELDEETGLYYFGARYYTPRESIWLSTDPLAEKYPNASPYNYCLGNPINFIDPDGMEPKLPPIKFSNKYVSNVLDGRNFSNYSSPVFVLGKILQGKSPFVINCWHAADRQVKNGTQRYYTSTDLVNDRVNMSKLSSQKDIKVDLQKGIDLTIKNLNEGQSVVAGVDYGPTTGSATSNSNKSTDHFINIVGYGKDEKGFYFSYYDNAIGGEKEGTDTINNRLYFNSETNLFVDEKGIHGKKITLTEVRDTKENPAGNTSYDSRTAKAAGM